MVADYTVSEEYGIRRVVLKPIMEKNYDDCMIRLYHAIEYGKEWREPSIHQSIGSVAEQIYHDGRPTIYIVEQRDSHSEEIVVGLHGLQQRCQEAFQLFNPSYTVACKVKVKFKKEVE